ncbi:hypothetical protein EC912_101717 [Luteibacter rhizovicinus]|uniref:Uncharacterized protein n=1 Tax=Luteibacter rhizovicinus TaxID=242606 RepID=A0A4R3YYH1_9GAMM|nr:hypothetical protein [Luteibacter rhizovicinus]TCV97700.1 hypothetical protein EC912_101717 [Luteibacter rhizovicinus]
MLKGDLKVAVPMPPPKGNNDLADWDLPDSTPCGVEIQGSEFKPVPGSPHVFVASAPEQFKLTVTATLLPGGAVELAYSRYVDESENHLISA